MALGETGDQSQKTVRLPAPKQESGTPVEQAIVRRRSVRSFSSYRLDLAEVSQLLWAAQGITSADGLRAAPSAGAMYPIEIYLLAGSVAGVQPGLYRYLPRNHAISLHLGGDLRRALAGVALGQWFIAEAPASILLTAVYRRTTSRYGDRGIRYVHMDAAHAAENVHLQVISLGLGTVVVGAFADEEVSRVLDIPKEEEPLIIMPVGRPR